MPKKEFSTDIQHTAQIFESDCSNGGKRKQRKERMKTRKQSGIKGDINEGRKRNE
jgi:hypothetical protein